MPEQLNNAEQIFDYIHQEVKRTFNLDLTRRDFIKLMSGGMLGAVVTGLNGQRTKAQENILGDATLATTETMPNGIAVGDINQTSAVLWTRSITLGIVLFEVLSNDDAIVTQAEATVTNAMQPVKVLIEGLRSSTSYRYRVTDASNNQLTGSFRTLADNGTHGLRFGVSGDWRGELRPYVGIANALERNLDFFVELGDTIYADHPSIDFPAPQARSLDEFRVKHNEVYRNRFGKNYWASLRRTVPIYATIDDHEVTNDFAGGASPADTRIFANESGDYVNQTAIYRNGLQAFREYNPIRDLNYSNTGDERIDGRPKLYRYLRAGQDAAMFILDARSFRDEAVDSVGNFFSSDEILRWRDDVWQTGRTMLGRTQVDDLKRDLLDAEEQGIIWKFVMMPEPIQQFGWFTGEDRWEGYAPERTEVLQYIEAQGIRNVVFVSADIHSTFISDISYQTEANGQQISTNIWEISTGSVGYYPPTGQGALELASNLGVLLPSETERYASGTLADKDAVLETVFNRFILTTQLLNPVGLEDSTVDYDLLQGGWTFGHSFGWTEFDIDAESHELLVTTYGIPAYSADDMSRNAETLLTVMPQILGQMRVRPVL
ncbi:MAG: alkaline phosphatase D family protein [Chloroflexota bacterium]